MPHRRLEAAYQLWLDRPDLTLHHVSTLTGVPARQLRTLHRERSKPKAKVAAPRRTNQPPLL